MIDGYDDDDNDDDDNRTDVDTNCQLVQH